MVGFFLRLYAKHEYMSTLAGLSLFLFLVDIFPARLNSRSLAVDVVLELRYFLATLQSIGNCCPRSAHQASIFISLDIMLNAVCL